jgi:hypothetical protein
MRKSVDRRSGRGPFVLIVALVATGAMCVQNAASALGFGWALIHGAGMPGFLYYDEKTQQPCLDLYSEITEAEIVAAIKKMSPDKYRVEISLTSDDVAVSVHHTSYVTSGEYDLQAMYQTIVTEGHQRCNIPEYERWQRR